MKFYAVSALVALVATSTQASAAEVAVRVGGAAEMDACAGLGFVTGIHTFLAVRSGPGVSYNQTGSLHNGHMLFLCSESADGQWKGVVYAAAPGLQDCGVSSPSAAAQPYRGPCKSGWVRSTWVSVLAG